MTTPLLPLPIFRAFDNAGVPLAGGLLYTYAAGTTTPQATYSDSSGLVQNANPVVLDSTGSATVRLGTSSYKFVLKDSTGVTTYWTLDNYVPQSDSPTFAGTVTASAISLSGQTFFSAQRSASTTLTAGAINTLVFDSQIAQNGSGYATGTGIFTAPANGIYSFHASIRIQNNAGGAATLSGIYFSINNSDSGGSSTVDFSSTCGVALGTTVNAGSNPMTMGGSMICKLSANDTVRIKLSNGATNAFTFNINSKFSGYLLG